MTEAESSRILELRNAAIIAPAGHGKTEMIVDLVERTVGKQLLLTHTNAGIDALEKRLKKRSVPKKKYSVSTIAAYCMKWCISYSQCALFDKNLSPLSDDDKSKHYYAQLYAGTKALFENSWPGLVLQQSYDGVIVDEYQDCTQEQHEIVLSINKFLPVYILGDPMQGIFSFAGKLVDWSKLEFQFVPVETKPWRWQKSNPQLGAYLTDIRVQLQQVMSGQKDYVLCNPCRNCVQLITPDAFDGYALLKDWQRYSSVLYLSRFEHEQLSICKRMAGIFQYDEKLECRILFEFAQKLESSSGCTKILILIEFVGRCSTSVNSEVGSYISRLENKSWDFSRIKKHLDFRDLLLAFRERASYDSLIRILSWFQEHSIFKIYRRELYEEMLRSIRYAFSESISISEAAKHIRSDRSLQKRYSHFKFLSSRTVLSKGLEYDAVIIDMRGPWSAKDFYVAMTRATRMVYLISSSNLVSFT